MLAQISSCMCFSGTKHKQIKAATLHLITSLASTYMEMSSAATLLYDINGIMEEPGFNTGFGKGPLDCSIDDFDIIDHGQSFPLINYTYDIDQNFNLHHQATPKSNDGVCNNYYRRPAKKPKTSPSSSSSSSCIISFGNKDHSNSTTTSRQLFAMDDFSPVVLVPKTEALVQNMECNINMMNSDFHVSNFEHVRSSNKLAAVGGTTRSALHAQEHVIAERRRREKLTESLIALAAVVPGLKKMDKLSVLGDAVKYLKHLQDRVKTLEEEAAKKTIESAVLVKKSQVYADDEYYYSSNDEGSDGCCIDQPLPEIETKISGKDVLIRILCQNQKGCVAKILTGIEKLNLDVLNTSVLPFGKSSTHSVTVVAQMDANFSISVKDVVGTLRQALVKKFHHVKSCPKNN